MKVEEEELVIPLTLSRSNIREQLKKKYVKVEPTDELTAEAIKALSTGEPLEADPAAFSSSNVVVSLPSKDAANDDAEEDAVDADYDEVPIEKFGLALLKGMGLKEEDIKGPTSE